MCMRMRLVPFRLMLSKSTSAYPSFMKMLTKWLQDMRPAVMEQPFPFTSISLNFNYNARLRCPFMEASIHQVTFGVHTVMHGDTS